MNNNNDDEVTDIVIDETNELFPLIAESAEQEAPKGHTNYSNNFTDIMRKAKFGLQRLANPGVFNDGDVDRLLFRNHIFIKFIRPDYILSNNILSETDYAIAIRSPAINSITEENPSGYTPGAKVMVSFKKAKKDATEEKEAIITKRIGHKAGDDKIVYYWIEYKDKNKDSVTSTVTLPPPLSGPEFTVYSYPVGDDRITEIKPEFYKLNDQKDVPFTEKSIYFFLQMHKFIMKKAFMVMRISLIYTTFSILAQALETKTFNGTITFQKQLDKIIRKDVIDAYIAAAKLVAHTYSKAKEKTKKGAEKVGEKLKKLSAGLSSLIDTITKSKTIDDSTPLSQKTEAIEKALVNEQNKDKEEEAKEDAEAAKQKGGATRRKRKENVAKRSTKIEAKKRLANGRRSRRLCNKKTRKMTGGGWIRNVFGKGTLLINPIYRKLSKYIDTTNLMNNTDYEKDKDRLIEQKRFLALAIMYFEQKRGINSNNIIPKIVIDIPPESGPAVNTIYIREKLLTLSFTNLFTVDNHDPSDSTAQIDAFIASRPEFQANTMRTLKDMFNYLYEVGYGQKMMYQQGGWNPFSGWFTSTTTTPAATPTTTTAPATTTTSWFGAKKEVVGLFKESWRSEMEKIFVYSFKRMVYDSIQTMHRTVKDKDALVEFYQQFVWCNLMTPHFTCNNIANLAIGFVAPMGVQTPHCYISGIISLMLKMTINPPIFMPIDLETGDHIAIPEETPPVVAALPAEPVPVSELPLPVSELQQTSGLGLEQMQASGLPLQQIQASSLPLPQQIQASGLPLQQQIQAAGLPLQQQQIQASGLGLEQIQASGLPKEISELKQIVAELKQQVAELKQQKNI